MKKIIIILFCSFLLTPLHLNADENRSIKTEMLPDGSYMKTEIIESKTLSRAAGTKSGIKTTKFYNASGVVEWQVSVTGRFTYSGSSSSCTSSTISTSVYKATWTITKKSASRNANQAIATATARLNNPVSPTNITKSVILSCSPNGTLY